MGGKEKGGREGRARLLPPVLYFSERMQSSLPQEGGTEYIIRLCVAQDEGSGTHKAISRSWLLELGQNLSWFCRETEAASCLVLVFFSSSLT